MRLTLRKLASVSGVSKAHLSHIERGERFPSAHVLRRIAEPLGFDKHELFTLVGFLSPPTAEDTREKPADTIQALDPYVAKVLSEEPLEVQHSVIAILTILKSLANSMAR